MKTLSIQQPWAEMICRGIKDVENRTWKPAEMPGRILIHAASKKVTRNFFNTIPEEWESHISNNQMMGNLPDFSDMETGAIIGYVTVTAFEDETDSVWDAGSEAIKWKLEDAWLFDEPIRNVKGKLNLFDYPLDENNLPPAHKVELKKMQLEGDNLIMPYQDALIETAEKEKWDVIESYFILEEMQFLFESIDPVMLKPIKHITLRGNAKTAKYEVKEINIANIPDIKNDTKPYTIHYHDGEEGPWQVVQCVIKND